MRWVQLRHDNAEIKEQLRTNNALLTSQNEMLKEILENAKVNIPCFRTVSLAFPHNITCEPQEAATVRASVDLAADDKGELGMPWTDMDQSVAAFSTMAKRQVRNLEDSVHIPRDNISVPCPDALPHPAPHRMQGVPLPPYGDARDVCPPSPAEGLPDREAGHVRIFIVSLQIPCYFFRQLKGGIPLLNIK